MDPTLAVSKGLYKGLVCSPLTEFTWKLRCECQSQRWLNSEQAVQVGDHLRLAIAYYEFVG